MDDKKMLQELIKIVNTDSSKALGCTEPVAIAYCANVAASYIDVEKIEKITVKLSKNIYKNAKAVKVPKTGRAGIDLSTALGTQVATVKDPLLVFTTVDEEIIAKADKLLEKDIIDVEVMPAGPDVYIQTIIEADKTIDVVIEGGHTNVVTVTLDDELLIDNRDEANPKDEQMSLKKLSFEDLKRIVDNADFKDVEFTLEGIEVNKKAAEEGLKGYGMGLGKSLKELYESQGSEEEILNKARYYTAAAADMRMGGGGLPVMTSGGSGNQGVGIILPIYIVAIEQDIDDETLAKSLFFAHCLNRYVKEYSGKLSGMCGCGIASSVGSTAGIVYMLGGTPEQIAGACSNIYGNLTGMICDGAKESCSLKLSTSAVESVIAAYLALKGVVVDPNVGVISETVEKTILNIGRLSKESFVEVDNTLIDII